MVSPLGEVEIRVIGRYLFSPLGEEIGKTASPIRIGIKMDCGKGDWRYPLMEREGKLSCIIIEHSFEPCTERRIPFIGL